MPGDVVLPAGRRGSAEWSARGGSSRVAPCRRAEDARRGMIRSLGPRRPVRKAGADGLVA